jgi:hypothetical protein
MVHVQAGSQHWCRLQKECRGVFAKLKINTQTGLLPKVGSVGVAEVQAYVYDIIDELNNLVIEKESDCDFELPQSFGVFLDTEEADTVKNIYEEIQRAGRAWTKHFIGTLQTNATPCSVAITA